MKNIGIRPKPGRARGGGIESQLMAIYSLDLPYSQASLIRTSVFLILFIPVVKLLYFETNKKVILSVLDRNFTSAIRILT